MICSNPQEVWEAKAIDLPHRHEEMNTGLQVFAADTRSKTAALKGIVVHSGNVLESQFGLCTIMPISRFVLFRLAI